MRSTIDARGSTITAAVALLMGIALIAGSLLRVGHRVPSVDVVSWTAPAAVKSPHVEQAVARKAVARASHVAMRATPVRFPSPNPGVPEGVGLSTLDDLAPPPVLVSAAIATPLLQPEQSDGFAAAANDLGEGLARGSRKAGARTDGFFKRFGKKVAASFGR